MGGKDHDLIDNLAHFPHGKVEKADDYEVLTVGVSRNADHTTIAFVPWSPTSPPLSYTRQKANPSA